MEREREIESDIKYIKKEKRKHVMHNLKVIIYIKYNIKR